MLRTGVFAFATLPASAAVDTMDILWGKTDATIAATFATRSIAVEFPFASRSGLPVRISALDADCECTTATTESSSDNSLGNGVVRVNIQLDGRPGEHRKAVRVYVNGRPEPAAVLKVTIKVPRVFRIEPKVLLFDGNDAQSGTSYSVYFEGGVDAPAVEAVSGDPAVRTQIVEIVRGREYRIVTRLAGETPAKSIEITAAISANGLTATIPLTLVLR